MERTVLSVRIVVDDLRGPDIARFLEEHLEEMRAVTPPGSKHALDLEGLRRPEITFWTLHVEDEIAACGALKVMDDRSGEIKSMRTGSAFRRGGYASTLLRHIIEHARAHGLQRLNLETGSTEHFAPARALYTKHGFEPCGPFADYTDDPHSYYMTKSLF